MGRLTALQMTGGWSAAPVAVAATASSGRLGRVALLKRGRRETTAALFGDNSAAHQRYLHATYLIVYVFSAPPWPCALQRWLISGPVHQPARLKNHRPVCGLGSTLVALAVVVLLLSYLIGVSSCVTRLGWNRVIMTAPGGPSFLPLVDKQEEAAGGEGPLKHDDLNMIHGKIPSFAEGRCMPKDEPTATITTTAASCWFCG